MIIKIPTINDSHTALITQCAPAEGKYGPQVCFTFSNGDQFYMPIKSATIQLIRCGFGDGNKPDEKIDFPAVANNTLFFSRTANKSTPDASPYYNIDIATGSPPAPSKRLPMTQSTTTSAIHKTPTPQGQHSRQQIAAAYAWSLATAAAAQTAAFPAVAKPTPDSIQRGAATLLIQLEKSGLMFEPATIASALAIMMAKPLNVAALDYEYEDDNLPF